MIDFQTKKVVSCSDFTTKVLAIPFLTPDLSHNDVGHNEFLTVVINQDIFVYV